MGGAPTVAAARLAVLSGAMMTAAAAFQLCHPLKHQRNGMLVGSPPSWLPPQQRLQVPLQQPTAPTTLPTTSRNLGRNRGAEGGSLRARWPFGGGGDKEEGEEEAEVVEGSGGGSDDGSAAAEDSAAVKVRQNEIVSTRRYQCT